MITLNHRQRIGPLYCRLLRYHLQVMRLRLVILLLSLLSCAHGARQGSPSAASVALSAPEHGLSLLDLPRPGEPAPPSPSPVSEKAAPLHQPEKNEGGSAPAMGPTDPERSAPSDESRARLVEAARRHLGRRFAGDCSRFIERVFSEAEVVLPPLATARSRSEALFRSLQPVSVPRPGDLAFFHATYNRDRRGTQRNRFTHVAMIEVVDGDRLLLIHRGRRGVRRFAMNLLRPHDPSENDRLRPRHPGDRSDRPVLAGELFAGFASVFEQEAATSRGEYSPS